VTAVSSALDAISLTIGALHLSLVILTEPEPLQTRINLAVTLSAFPPQHATIMDAEVGHPERGDSGLGVARKNRVI